MYDDYTAYRRPHDLGTPEVESGKSITLMVDGKEVTVPEGTTVAASQDQPFLDSEGRGDPRLGVHHDGTNQARANGQPDRGQSELRAGRKQMCGWRSRSPAPFLDPAHVP